jgi:hypothetical protein
MSIVVKISSKMAVNLSIVSSLLFCVCRSSLII